jgi:hypothetical protein
MGQPALRMAVLVQLLLVSSRFAAEPIREDLVANKLAHVYRFTLPPGSRVSVTASTGHGLVWVALTDGVVGLTEPGAVVREGTVDRVDGKVCLTLQARTGRAAKFVVVDVLDAFQRLTVDAHGGMTVQDKELVDGSDELEPGQTIYQGSDQNDTLIIALGDLHLRDVWNLDGDESWRPSEPVNIELLPGGVQWTRPGMHQFTNMAGIRARFVRVEW